MSKGIVVGTIVFFVSVVLIKLDLQDVEITKIKRTINKDLEGIMGIKFGCYSIRYF
jgi:heterodisulfide reductase subunit B